MCVSIFIGYSRGVDLEWGGAQGIKFNGARFFYPVPYTLNIRLRQYVTFLFAISVVIINLTLKLFKKLYG
jgi:hypothetical protein